MTFPIRCEYALPGFSLVLRVPALLPGTSYSNIPFEIIPLDVEQRMADFKTDNVQQNKEQHKFPKNRARNFPDHIRYCCSSLLCHPTFLLVHSTIRLPFFHLVGGRPILFCSRSRKMLVITGLMHSSMFTLLNLKDCS